MKSFIAECRRRGVFPVAAVYIAAAWVVLEVVSLAFESWGIPPERLQLVWIAAFIGFPVAFLFGWRYDITADGILKTPPTAVDQPAPVTRFDYALFGLTAIVVVAATVLVFQTEPADKLAQKPVLAVLPFDDLSPEQDQAYFADGIAAETLNLLARYDGLTVISRRASFSLRDETVDINRIAGRLGATHVLEGSVRKTADSLRVSAQLVDAADGSTSWSETFERPVADIQAVEKEVAQQVARELKARLLVTAKRHELGDPQTYDVYLRGLASLAKQDQPDAQLAASLFEQVLETDPEFAPAWGSLALARFWSFVPAEQTLEAALRALELDPRNSDALAVRGRLLVEEGNRDEGREYLRAAIRENPSNPMAMRWLATSYSVSNPSEYATLIDLTFSIDPLDPTIQRHKAMAAVSTGRYDGGLTAAKALVSSSGYPFGLQYAVATHEYVGQLARATKTAYLGYLETGTREVRPWWHVVDIMRRMGEFDLAEAWLDELEIAWGVNSNTVVARTSVAVLRGDTEKTRQLIDEARTSGLLEGQPLAVALFVRAGDSSAARTILEDMIGNWRDRPVEQLRQDWPRMRLYAEILSNTGDTEAAIEIAEVLIPRAEELASNGAMYIGALGLDMQLAQLHAIRGDRESMILNLERALSMNLLFCRECMELSPVWDPYREDPEFVEIMAAHRSYLESQHQILEDEGMLLTPAQVREMGKFDFDPFTR